MKLLLATINPKVHNGAEDLSLRLIQTAPIYRIALTAGQLALVGSGGAGGYTYSVTGLPAGLTLNTATGAITGTPTTISHNIVTATVTDSATNTFTTTFSIDVLTRIAITGAFQPSVEVGFAVSNQLSVTGATGSITWSISASPYPGGAVSFNTSTGLLSGTPTGVGSWAGTVTATDSGTGDQATYSFTQAIIPGLASAGSRSSFEAIVGTSLAIPDIGMAGGKPPFSYAPRTVGSVTNGTITVAY